MVKKGELVWNELRSKVTGIKRRGAVFSRLTGTCQKIVRSFSWLSESGAGLLVKS